MRELLFDLNDDGKLDDKRIALFDEFRDVMVMGEPYMRYVMLTTDYNSPYWSQPLWKRKQSASDKIFQKQIAEDIRLEKAAVLYNEIQYDELVEQYKSQKHVRDVFTQELNMLSAMGSSKQEVEKIIRATDMQKLAEKEMERLEEKILVRRTQETVTKGDRIQNYYEVYRKRNDVSKLAIEGIENYKKNAN